jgi:NTP pyrophosphatase (non-canonical NTP hydrolase)
MTLAKPKPPSETASAGTSPPSKRRQLEIEVAAETLHANIRQEARIAISSLGPQTEAIVTQLGTLIAAWNKHQGFWESDNVGEKIALMHTELAEATEADRKDLQSDHISEFTGVEEELADTLIRIFDFAGHFNLRLGQALTEKLLFNLQRPHKHGKGY